MSDDNIIPIATRSGKPPVAVASRPWDACKHEAVIVDEQQRVVDCDECGARLDPITVIGNLARRWDRWRSEYERVAQVNREYEANERAKWERARDRHLNANPGHVLDQSGGYERTPGECRVCVRLNRTMPRAVKTEMRAALEADR